MLTHPESEVENTASLNTMTMVNTVGVMDTFKKIVILMEAAISNADRTAYRDFDEMASYMRLFEAMDHYLSFMLGNSTANIGFDYYINEYFARFAPYLFKTPGFIQQSSILFAEAAGYLCRCLAPAKHQIENSGGLVDEVESTSHKGWELFTYLVTGHYTKGHHTDMNLPAYATVY